MFCLLNIYKLANHGGAVIIKRSMCQHAAVVIKAFLSASLLLRNRKGQKRIRENEQSGSFRERTFRVTSWNPGYSSQSSETTLPG